MPKSKRGPSRKSKEPPKTALFRSPLVTLDAAAVGATEGSAPVWIQIARTGLWRGYIDGQVQFTREMFETIIANFHAHPWFKAGPNGLGEADVVPWDFDHGGEIDPPAHPEAQSWTQDLQMREGTDGEAELWSYTRLLEPVRTWIADGKMKSASVAVWRNAVDPVTARDIGPLLTSVAFTNKPFIQGMEPIAASMNYYVSRATDAEDAVCQIKGLLGLPQLAGVGDVQIEVAKLKMWLEQGAVPLGVDADEIVAGLRTVLGLPALAPAAEVFAELVKLVPALIEQQTEESAEGGGGANVLPTAAPPMLASTRGTRGKPTMEPKKRDELCIFLGLSAGASDDHILAAAKAGPDAKTKLGALLKALGVEDSDGAIGKITGLMKQAAELEAAMPELAALKDEKKKKDASDEESDVSDAIAAHALPETTRDALILLRRSDIKKFNEQFPLPKPGERHLSTELFTTRTGAQIGSKQTGAGGAPVRLAASGGRTVAGGDDDDLVTAVEQQPGRNLTEKAMSFVRCTVPGADKWTFDQLHGRGVDIAKQIRELRSVSTTASR